MTAKVRTLRRRAKKYFAMVSAECARWGIEVIVVDYLPWRLESPSTAGFGCSTRLRRVYVRRDLLADGHPEFGSAMLHEMSHVVFGAKVIDIEEVESGMLALEYEAKERLRILDWPHFMKHYSIGDDWFDATPEQRADALLTSAVGAVAAGIFDNSERPTYRQEKRTS